MWYVEGTGGQNDETYFPRNCCSSYCKRPDHISSRNALDWVLDPWLHLWLDNQECLTSLCSNTIFGTCLVLELPFFGETLEENLMNPFDHLIIGLSDELRLSLLACHHRQTSKVLARGDAAYPEKSFWRWAIQYCSLQRLFYMEAFRSVNILSCWHKKSQELSSRGNKDALPSYWSFRNAALHRQIQLLPHQAPKRLLIPLRTGAWDSTAAGGTSSTFTFDTCCFLGSLPPSALIAAAGETEVLAETCAWTAETAAACSSTQGISFPALFSNWSILSGT